jgi:DNA-binding NarL/FixJ family response regulator
MNTAMHEHLIHTLSALLIELQSLQGTMQRVDMTESNIEMLRAALRGSEGLLREALTAIRMVQDEFPCVELEGTTLPEALSRMVEETAERLNLASRISFSGVDEQNRPLEHTLAPYAEKILYLVVREALYIIEQHTGTRRLRFSLQYGQDAVSMSIEDDGKSQSLHEAEAQEQAAPPLQQPEPSFSVEERSSLIFHDLQRHLESLGGSLHISFMTDGGTRIQVYLPYRELTVAVSESSDQAKAVEGQTSADADGLESSSIDRGTPVVRILLVDALAMTRAGLHRLLDTYPYIQVIGEATDGIQAVSETLELGPQVVLMDAQLPEGQSLEALRQIKQLNLETKVLLLTALENEDYLYEMLRAGADGYILKDIQPDELAQAIRTVARGEVLLQSQLAGRLLSRFGRQRQAPYATLTTRELEVLRLLARGLRNKEIAARLFVSERTINFHLANIYQKLNVSGRTEALSKAIELGMIVPGTQESAR